MRELQECAESLNKKILKIGKIFDIRWVASSFKTTKAVLNNLESLYDHFLDAAESRIGKEKHTFRGLAIKLASPDFLLELGAIHDALFELSDLSLILQDKTTTLDKADREMRRTIFRLQLMKDKPGTQMLNILESVKNMKHGTVILQTNLRHVKLNYTQFLTSLVDNMNSRLFSNSQEETNTFIADIKVLDPVNWPDVTNPDFGHNEVYSLCERFNVKFAALVVRDFHNYVDNLGKEEFHRIFVD